eukprot:3939887-Rhodomonas_salina.1
MKRARVWHEDLGKLLSPAALLILDGRLSIPLDEHDIPSFERPNLKTCEGEEKEAFLDGIIAEYLVTGVLSWCPPGKKPRCVSPLSVVPKKTFPFHRMVIDLRGVNEYTSRWPSRMRGMTSASMLFTPGA